MNQQLALAIPLNDEATFADFCWGKNAFLQQELQKTLSGKGEKFIYLWGGAGSGKSHVLQACCQSIEIQSSAVYLPLQTLKEWGPSVIEGMEEQALISIDDIDTIASHSEWEEAIFHLYNRIRDKENTILLISGQTPPAQSLLRLPDLRSRLSWGLVIQLKELDDHDKIQTLTWHARKRGFELPIGVVQFLLNRCSRNMHDLYALLNQLDEASLRAKRKITLPFVKSILNM